MLCYVLLGPSWQSSYDARVDSSTSNLQFIYYGNITNNSGEDFLDVCIINQVESKENVLFNIF